MPGRTWVGGDQYRYSHNGHEREDEIYANAQSAEHWMYDSRIIRRWEMDPITFEWQSPYACFDNNPVFFSDPLGAASGTGTPGGGDKGGKDGGKGNTPSSEQTKQAGLDALNKNCPGCYVLDGDKYVLNPNAPSQNNPASQPAPAPNNSSGPTLSQGQSPEAKAQTQSIEAFNNYGGDGSGSFSDWGMWTLDQVRIFSPLTQLNDAINISIWGKDSRGIPKSEEDIGYSILGSLPLMGPEARLSQKIGRDVIKNAAAQEGKYSVYIGVDNAQKIRYVGITGRNPALRFAEHGSAFGTGKEFLRFETVKDATSVTKINARIIEQKLINKFGMQKNGGQLFNKINSITPADWGKYGILGK